MCAVSNEQTPFIPAVDRALNVLEYAANKRTPVTIRELETNLQLPHTTAFRLVKQLLFRGYLAEDENKPGYYRLGLQLLVLSKGLTYVNDLRQIAHTELNRLAVESGQAVQMGILKGSSVNYIEQILPPNPVLIYTTPFAELPLNISASGKVLAAYAPANVLEQILANAQFTKQTPKTLDTVDAFVSQLARVRELGYAVDDEEFALGIGCLAAPIFNHKMECVAAVGITGSIHNYQGDSMQALADTLLQSAKAISIKLGMSFS